THQELWDQALTSPTPNLTSLTIVHMDCSTPILPFAPRIYQLDAMDCSFELCRSLPQIKSLRIANPKNETRVDAQGIISLKLDTIHASVQLPSVLPALKETFMAGDIDPKAIFVHPSSFLKTRLGTASWGRLVDNPDV
ncbi:5475_t:CDS:2, partial [Acaulospora colombiana]